MLSTSSLVKNLLLEMYQTEALRQPFTAGRLHDDLRAAGETHVTHGGVCGMVSKLTAVGALAVVGKVDRAFHYNFGDIDALIAYNARSTPGRGSQPGRLDGPHHVQTPPQLAQLASLKAEVAAMTADPRSRMAKLQDALLDAANELCKLPLDLDAVPTDDLLAELGRRTRRGQ